MVRHSLDAVSIDDLTDSCFRVINSLAWEVLPARAMTRMQKTRRFVLLLENNADDEC